MTAPAAFGAGRTLVCAALGAVLMAGSLAEPARALCGTNTFAGDARDARRVFVGTVVFVSLLHTHALVRVDKIYKGGPLPAVVEVNGGLVERADFDLGRQYAFAVSEAGPTFSVSACGGAASYPPYVSEYRLRGGPNQPSWALVETEPVLEWFVLISFWWEILVAILVFIAVRRR